MVEAIANFLILGWKTVTSGWFWTLLSVIAIIITIGSIVTVVINRSKDRDGKIEDFIQIGGSILLIIIAGIILKSTC